MRVRDDSGQVTALTASVLVVFVVMFALVVGGAEVLRARSDAFGAAAGAARAGAQELEEAAVVQGTVELDPEAAQAAAQSYLAARGATGSVSVSGTDVTVTVSDSLAIPRLGEVIGVEATATVSAIKGDTP
jgi:regulator of protease activity HflC (stomatin/prohibitin superfamily)